MRRLVGAFTDRLLNLLNELGKRDKMRGLPSILSLFHNEFINILKESIYAYAIASSTNTSCTRKLVFFQSKKKACYYGYKFLFQNVQLILFFLSFLMFCIIYDKIYISL